MTQSSEESRSEPTSKASAGSAGAEPDRGGAGTLPIPVPRPRKPGSAVPTPKAPPVAKGPAVPTPKAPTVAKGPAVPTPKAPPVAKGPAVPTPKAPTSAGTAGDGAEASADADAVEPSTPERASTPSPPKEAPVEVPNAEMGGTERAESSGEDAGVEPAAERLSVVEADAAASAFRPSWEVDSEGWSADDAPPTPSPEPAAPIVHEPSVVIADASLGEPGAATTTVSVDEDEEPVLPVSQPPWKMLAVIGVVAAVAVGGVIASFTGGETPTPATTETAAAGPATATASAAAPADTAEQANAEQANAEQANAEQANAEQANAEQASAEQANAEQANAEQANAEQANTAAEPPQIHVRLAATPEGASLTLDGQPIPNPYEATVPLDHGQHRLVATLDGYREANRTLGFDGDREAVLTLTPIPAPEPPPTMAAAPTMAAPPTMATAARRHTTRSSSMRSSSMRSRHPSSMRSSSMRGRRRGAGFTSANPY